MTRVYLPTTMSALATAYVAGGFDAGHAAHSVTATIREWYTDGDAEQLEYVAFTEAGRTSLRLVAADLTAVERYEHRRVVVAADVDAACVESGAGPDAPRGSRSSVRLTCTVPLAKVVSVHVDGDEARSVVAEAVRALPAAEAGDEEALFALDETEAHDLLWYDVSEIADLI